MQVSNLCTLLVVHAAERIEFVSDLAVSEPQSPLIANWKLSLSFHDRDSVYLQQGLAWKRDATHRSLMNERFWTVQDEGKTGLFPPCSPCFPNGCLSSTKT